MKRLLNMLPGWDNFLLYIGGIPSLITGGIITFMALVTCRNKAFSPRQLNTLRKNNKLIIRKEDELRHKILNSPRWIRYLYSKWIGTFNYHDLINRR